MSALDRISPKAIVVSGVVVAVAGVSLVFALRTSGGSSAAGHTAEAPVATQSPLPFNAARDWMEGALKDFDPMKGVLVGFVQTSSAWRQGKASDVEQAGNIERAVPAFLATRASLEQRAVFAKAPRALEDYRQAVTLYVQSARISGAATQVQQGPLHEQLELSYARVQVLADRVFDQAAVELKPYLPPAAKADGVTLSKGPEVPEWSSLGIAAGSPLDRTPAEGPARTYVEHRPEQPLSMWKATVAAAAVPPVQQLVHDLANGTTEQLRSLSDRYDAASDHLYARADPQGERTASTRVQLALLADSEAARAAQAATLASPVGSAAALKRLAESLALVGDALWDTRLGAQSTGYDRALLTS